MTNAADPVGFSLEDLARVRVPQSPIGFGARVVYVLRRTDLGEKKTRSSLWAVPLGGGEPVRLTQGAWADRAPRSAPNGEFLVFVSQRGFGDQLYRLAASGGDARRLTALPRGTIGDLALSPDGSRVALILSPAAPEDDALPLAADLARAEAETTPLEAPAAPELDPSPPKDERGAAQARVIARMKNREDGIGWFGGARAQIWLVDAKSGHARRVTRGPRDFSALAWLPSGDGLIAVATLADPEEADRDSLKNALVRVDLESGSLEPLAKPEGAALAPSVSPKGDRVAYLVSPPDDPFGHGNIVVWLSSLCGGEAPRALGTDLDRPAIDLVGDDLAGGTFLPVAPIWSANGGELTVVVTDRGSVRLCTLEVASGAGQFRTPAGRAIASPASAASGALAVIVSDRSHFSEIGVVSSNGEVSVLTGHNAELAATVAPREPELVTLEREGAVISGYYLAPRNATRGTRSPAILYIHGGPHVCYGERLFFEMQWLADAGFAVFYGNPRGSHSFGEAYSSAIGFHWGDPDAADQLAFADWLAARPEIDPERIGVAGGSYGGYMTLHLCGTTNRFRAAVAQRGLYDWALSVADSDFGHESARNFGGAWPWQDPTRYLDHSPMRLVDRVQTPMLVIHNEGDLRVGSTQALMLFHALKRRGVPSALVLFPEENHGMSRAGRIDRRLERLRQIRAWFEAWL
jgi:dipeptidyl aminopeptidase/acylaminoacyl peptidase